MYGDTYRGTYRRVVAMRRTSGAIVMLFAVNFFIFVPALRAQPTEESLIQAWENVQKQDPETITFKKLESRRYVFNTKRFPFDGELKILNVSIDASSWDVEDRNTIGVVEVELVRLPQDFLQKFGRSYSFWEKNNTLFYDKKDGRWLSSREFQSKMAREAKSLPASSLMFLSGYFWVIIFVFIFVALLLASRKSTRSMKIAMQRQDQMMADYKRAMQLTEENTKILREILEVLKSK